jgi:hypothetical protein
MIGNKWQRKKQANARKSANQHAAKARLRMAAPAHDYPADRLSGRYANILINLPWMQGKNTVCIAVDFAPRPHRSDQYLVDGEVTTLTELCRSVVRKNLPQIRSHADG